VVIFIFPAHLGRQGASTNAFYEKDASENDIYEVNPIVSDEIPESNDVIVGRHQNGTFGHTGW
jgi:hypothetical protein